MQPACGTVVLVVVAMMTCLVSPAGSMGLSAGEHGRDISAMLMDDDKELPLLEGLLRQREIELRAKGERLTVMCVGESGTGKSSLISNIFTVPLGTALPSTVKITETVLNLVSDGVPLTITFIDTPGYGDDVILSNDFDRITKHLDDRFRCKLKRELHQKMYPKSRLPIENDPVDVVLFFISPHRFKGVDVLFLKKIQGRTSIIPVLSKADTMTKDELDYFRNHVKARLEEENIEYYEGPYAIISSPYRNESTSPLEASTGRRYPWGTAESEYEPHSDLTALRRRLLTDGLGDLKRASDGFYETYRAQSLLWKRGWRGALKSFASAALINSAIFAAWAFRPDALREMTFYTPDQMLDLVLAIGGGVVGGFFRKAERRELLLPGQRRPRRMRRGLFGRQVPVEEVKREESPVEQPPPSPASKAPLKSGLRGALNRTG